MEIIYYIIWGVFLLLIIYYIFLKFYENKINLLEEKIKKLFSERTALIPWVFEISNIFLTKHDEIFHEILNLRKMEFSQANNNIPLSEIMSTKKLIHHEINFIFKVCNKHPKLIKEWNFIYLRNLIIKKSSKIWKEVKKYKMVTKKFNKLIFYKNLTIIWLLFPISKKVKI